MKYKFPKVKVKLNLALQLVLIFAAVLVFGDKLPLSVKSMLYALSLSLKEMLVLVLPFIIFTCLFYSLIEQQGRAVRFVLVLLVTVCLSEFVSIQTAYWAGKMGLSYIAFPNQALDNLPVLEPFFEFSAPVLVSPERSLIAGLVMGLFFSFYPHAKVVQFARKSNQAVTFFLKRLFVPTLPLFVIGYILKMQHEGILLSVLSSYTPIIGFVFLVNVLYIILMFGLSVGFNLKLWTEALKNVLPAMILGFTTMSSLATMPVTLNATEKNTQDPALARAIIPATVNIHMIGVCLTIPIVAMAVLLTFGVELPSFMQYLLFSQFFMIATFAIPGVPYGSIIILLPVLEKYLGFTSEMSAFVTATYFLFDPIVTLANVSGNSALALFLKRVLGTKPALQSEFEKSEESPELAED